MHTIPTLTALLALATTWGCGPRTVPDDALARVPSSAVAELGEIQEELAAVEDRLAETRDERRRAQVRLEDRRETFESVSDQLDEAEERQLTAIQEGDAVLAQSAESNVATLQERVEERSAAYSAASDEHTELALEQQMLEAEVKWLKAHLEAERARGAVAGGADLALKRFERRESRFKDDYEQFRQQWLASLEPSERDAVEEA